MTKKVLLLGTYGQTNLGDDLLMWNYLQYLRDRGYKEIYVNANSSKNIPQVIKDTFPDLKVLLTYKTTLGGWVRVLRQVDCVVYGGGTVYKELYGSTGRGRYSVIGRIMVFNLLARLLGVRIYHLHIGIGVLKTRLGRLITRAALRLSNVTIFRDAESYAIARNDLKVPANTICQSTDGLFMNDRWLAAWNPAPRLPRHTHKRVVGINMLADIPDWVDRRTYIAAMREFITGLIADKALVVLLPFQHDFNPNNDLKFMQQHIVKHFKGTANLVVVDHVSIDQAVAYLQQLDVFVGMRFHSLLLATAVGTPYIGIAYDTKCWRFLKEAQYPYALQLEDMQASNLNETYDALVRNLPKAVGILKAVTKRYQQKGQRCLDKIAL